MANIDAINSILAGENIWRDYLATTIGVVDLSFADLCGADLRNRVIERCNFTGAQLQGANFDSSTINNSTFIGANLSNASLVDCTLQNIVAKNMMSQGIIIRKSTLVNVDLSGSNISFATIDSTQFQECNITEVYKDGFITTLCKYERCTFSGLKLSCLSFHQCTIRCCELTEWDIDNIEILNTVIEDSTLTKIIARAGSMLSSRFFKCYIDKIDLGPIITCQELDFSQSTVTYTDLRLIGLNTATMLDTALTFCIWPEQKGHTSKTGAYIPSPYLLAQPVQDLKGVPPLLRREIADAQYLLQKIAKSRALGRLLLRFWGLCTGFGQSLLRLSLTSCCLLIIITISLLVARHQLFKFNEPFNIQFLAKAAQESFQAFFALGDIKDYRSLELIVIILARICGFVVLGLWVTIAAAKLNRLGSE